MTAGVFLLLAVASTFSPGLPDPEVLAAAERAFAEGVEQRDDVTKARPAFARAANGYDELWRRGVRNPELALNRSHAHRLAGDLPGAVVALHEGLAMARWSRALQVALADARAAVGYPLVGDLAEQCRPVPATTIGTRMSPVEAWGIAAVLWVLMCGAMARFAMVRAVWCILLAGLLAVALALLGGLWLQDYRHHQREIAEPLVIVTEDVFLRKGNTATYLPRLESKLPVGVEARELTRRGGWVQIRLAGGTVGWVPARAVIIVEHELKPA
jgi:hypothetical protein